MNDFVKNFDIKLPDGAHLFGQQVGKGHPVLFISGLAGTACFWQASTAQMRSQRCITFDQRGIGASARGNDPLSIEQLAQDCITILDEIDLPSAHIVGHSTGGCIAMTLALQNPERVRSLVLSATWGHQNNYMKSLFGLRKELLLTQPGLYARLSPFLAYPTEWLEQHPELMTMPSREWSEERIRIVHERIEALLAFDRLDDLGKIKCPTLIMGARDDLLVPDALQKTLQRHIPHAESYWFDRAGHFYPVSRYEQFARLVLSWTDANEGISPI